MRILVVGAYGLIGSYITARLLAAGHEVTGLGRDVLAASRRWPQVRWIAADLRRLDVVGWGAILEGVQSVVNCAGALQDSPRDDLEAVHLKTVADLIQACSAAGLRRLVQISAAGVERASSPFETTKLAAERSLMASGLEWIILRPALVLAPAAYGGSGLLRALAAFPFAMPAARPDSIVQTVSVEEVAEAVLRSVEGPTANFVCDLAASEPTLLRDVLWVLRAWLGLSPAPVLEIPPAISGLAGWVADGLAWLGWRSPMRTAALRQLSAGVQGRHSDAMDHLGLEIGGLQSMFGRWPAGVQERWYARLYFLKPLALAVLAAFWSASGVIGVVREPAAAQMLTGAGFSPGAADAAVLAGAAMDILLAVLVCVRRSARLALVGMVLATGGYLAAATIWTPALWADPLGPLVKSIPAAMLAMAAWAMMDER